MRILAIETSTRSASVALLDDAAVAAAITLPETTGTASGLAPAIGDAADQAGWSLRGIDLIAVSIGPGSFTGLRVGVTTAKTLAYALNCDVLGVDTLETIAAGANTAVSKESVSKGAVSHAGDVCAVLDAQRQQLFCGRYHFDSTGESECRQQAHIVDLPNWLASLGAGELVTGPGLRRLVSRLPAGIHVAPETNWRPQAETVGRIALRRYAQGRRDDCWRLSPHYLRRSAAEEKRDARNRPAPNVS